MEDETCLINTKDGKGQVRKMLTLLLICAKVIYFASSIAVPQTCEGDIRVETENFTFCGKEEVIASLGSAKVHTFLGIKYGQAPKSARRFKKPEPFYPEKRSAKTLVNAIKYGPSCPQLKDPLYQSQAGARMWVARGSIDEDCLYLNVWKPKSENTSNVKLLPVFVWIYGGGFESGTSDLMIYDGTIFAAHQNVIVVSINYRLSAFGFFYLSNDTIPGNMALWDQHLALLWVNRNIEKFGGDPNRVTLAGESAGAVSVSAHVISPYSQRLFRNAILQSSSVLADWAIVNKEMARNSTLEVVNKLNCYRSTDQEIVNCLGNLDMSTILNTIPQIVPSDPDTYFAVPFKPILDGNFLPYVTGEEFNDLGYFRFRGSLLTGVNKNEGSYFLLYAFLSDTQFKQGVSLSDILTNQTEYYTKLMKVMGIKKGKERTEEAVKNYWDLLYMIDFFWRSPGTLQTVPSTKATRLEELASDKTFKCATIDFAKKVAAKGNSVYFYNFNYRTKSLQMPKWLGTMHGYEIEYMLGMPFHQGFRDKFYDFTDIERKISSMMMTYWGNFVRTGNPNIYPSGKEIGGNTSKLGENGLPINNVAMSMLPKMSRWGPYKNSTEEYIDFGEEDAQISYGNFLKKKACNFLDNLYPALYMAFAEERIIKQNFVESPFFGPKAWN
ncbi:hypothetical protein Ciccas_010066 [Cichlidogyrus casuarinus]|uniref:Carboxylic ester hydrolase n=1 Tax=Cichlidogyrus casuarinus TaxID=1844966 RepID=A0ABD2PVY7_9PLAT